MEKTNFETLYQKDVNKHVEKKNNLSYLSWSYAWAEVKKFDEKANYTIHENIDGNPFFVSQFGIDVKVSVTVKEVTHTMRLPVLDGANKSIKIESYKYSTKFGDKTVEAADSFSINKAIMRCLVKAIAMHGLGLYLYNGEDMPEKTEEEKPMAKAKIVNIEEKKDLGITKEEFNKIKQSQREKIQVTVDDLERLGKKVNPWGKFSDDLEKNAKLLIFMENKVEDAYKEYKANKEKENNKLDLNNLVENN